MRVIIAEKPSVAMDIAKALGTPEKGEGYFRVNGVMVTWAVGHLYEIKEENERWTLDGLPILPNRFDYQVSQGKAERVKTIQALLKDAEDAVNACDAGREGELIFRLVVGQAGFRGRISRLWTSEALSAAVVRRELDRLRPGENYDSLYQAALARQHADWIVGINLTRLLTLRANDRTVWSAGRVQTPVLRLIVDRMKEIENFKPEPYWLIKVKFRKDEKDFIGWMHANGPERKFLEKGVGDKALQTVSAAREGVVREVKTERKQQLPPHLHSITSLQRESNERLGLTADRTLALAQDLYEAKLISYPRSDAEHLDETPQTKEMVRRLLAEMCHPELIPAVDEAGKRVFDTSKLTDHYAMIPQREYKNEPLSDDHRRVYELIARRFIGVFMPAHEIDQTVADLDVNGLMARATGKVEVQEGWKALHRKDVEEEPGDEDKDQALPFLLVDDRAEKTGQEILAKKTAPPKKHTESSLLAVMEKLGLGTPATRAAVIERLKKVAYVAVEKKILLPTAKGREVIGKIGDRPVADPETTGQWEAELEEIYQKDLGESGYQEFMGRVRKHVAEEIGKFKAVQLDSRQGEAGTCQCGGSIKEMPKTFICGKCQALIWKESFGRTFTKSQAATILAGKKIEVKKLKSKAGKTFDAKVYYDFTEKKIKLEFN